jgi:hypothetical protein
VIIGLRTMTGMSAASRVIKSRLMWWSVAQLFPLVSETASTTARTMRGLGRCGPGLAGVADFSRSGAEEVGVFRVGGEFIFEQGHDEIKCTRV